MKTSRPLIFFLAVYFSFQSICFAGPFGFESQTQIETEERLLQIIQNISNYILQERIRNNAANQGQPTEDKQSEYIINPNMQQTISWETSLLPKQHSNTTTSTTTGGVLITKDTLSAGLFVSYIYSLKNKHNDSPTRQEDSSISISPTFSYMPTKNFYFTITPAIAIRNVEESYLVVQDIDVPSFPGTLTARSKRSYTALDTSLTPEIGYTFELNDFVSITPSLSAPFS